MKNTFPENAVTVGNNPVGWGFVVMVALYSVFGLYSAIVGPLGVAPGLGLGGIGHISRYWDPLILGMIVTLFLLAWCRIVVPFSYGGSLLDYTQFMTFAAILMFLSTVSLYLWYNYGIVIVAIVVPFALLLKLVMKWCVTAIRSKT